LAIADRELPKSTKAVTLRLPENKAAQLEAIARADEKSVNQTLVEAVDRMIAERRKDKAFKARVRAIIERDRDILEDLAR
jgi:hypothetical protein